MADPFVPVYELTRGQILESIHHGAAAVVDSRGNLLASIGDPRAVTFLRSSAKPFQALPFIERGGDQQYHLSQPELAILCASHTGSDLHVETVRGIQARVGLQESDLLCGVHQPDDKDAFDELVRRAEMPTPIRNNCSGKHTGMLAHAKMRGLPLGDYLDRSHPIQQDILAGFAAMCGLDPERIELGVDGCSAPNFAVPLHNAALAFARLADPHDLPAGRADACQRITAAMTAAPEMVSGPGKFDAVLMRTGAGQIVSKGGAEGFLAVGLLPGALGNGSPGVGIALKIADGDLGQRTLDGKSYNRARPAVMVEILRQIGALGPEQLSELADFAPTHPIRNHRGLVTGEGRPVFTLERARAHARPA